MEATRAHVGYGYNGFGYFKVNRGERFEVASNRAADLISRKVARLVVEAEADAPTVEPVAAPVVVAPEPEKVDKRTKAYKAGRR